MEAVAMTYADIVKEHSVDDDEKAFSSIGINGRPNLGLRFRRADPEVSVHGVFQMESPDTL